MLRKLKKEVPVVRNAVVSKDGNQDVTWGEVVQRMGPRHLEPHVARAKEEVPVAHVCVRGCARVGWGYEQSR